MDTILSAVMRQSCRVCQHRGSCQAKATIPLSMMKFWSSVSASLIHLSNHYTVLASKVVSSHSKEMLMDTSCLLTFTNQELSHCLVFKMYIAAFIEVTVMLPSAKRNSWDYQKTVTNVQGLLT